MPITFPICFTLLLLFNALAAHSTDSYEVETSISNSTCTVKYGRRLLREGNRITIHRKLYKVEDCQLQRAYQTCGHHLWHVVNIVCEAIDLHKGKGRPIARARRFMHEKLLSEACCQESCTVSEMTRYCPS